MKKHTYFGTYIGPDWPDQRWLAPYFLTPAGRQAAFDGDNDSWSLNVDGLEGTEHLPQWNGRIDIMLTIVGNLEHGVLLCHQKLGPNGIGHYSRGDLSRLRDYVETKQDSVMPVGLFIPFERAWDAIKEFVEADGALPKSIPWIAVPDLPRDTFPDPYYYFRGLKKPE
jgi:hypothetical protein